MENIIKKFNESKYVLKIEKFDVYVQIFTDFIYYDNDFLTLYLIKEDDGTYSLSDQSMIYGAYELYYHLNENNLDKAAKECGLEISSFNYMFYDILDINDVNKSLIKFGKLIKLLNKDDI